MAKAINGYTHGEIQIAVTRWGIQITANTVIKFEFGAPVVAH
jgi:hypothetical protein